MGASSLIGSLPGTRLHLRVVLAVCLLAACELNTAPPPLSEVDAVSGDTGITVTTTTITEPAELAGIDRVRGNLVIAATRPIRLPDLVVVEGDLRVLGTEARPVMADLNLPKLARVGGNLEIGWTTGRAKLLAPTLAEVGGHLSLFEGEWSISLPSLKEVNGDVRLTHGALESLELDRLATVGGSIRAIAVTPARGVGYALPSLEGVGVDFVIQGGSAFIDAPRCLSIGGSLVIDGATAGVMFTGLREVMGDVRVEDSTIEGFDLGGILAIGDDLVFDRVAGGSFERIELYALASVGGDVRIDDVEGLTFVGFPALLAINGGFIVANAPLLEEVVATRVVTVGGSLILENAGDVELTLIQLVTVGGDLVSSGNLAWQGNLFQITDIAGDVRISHQRVMQLGLLNLASVGGSVVLDDVSGSPEPDELRFDSLRTVGRSFKLINTHSFERCTFDALLTIQDGDLVVRDNPDLTRLTLSGLGAVAGAVIVRDNPKLPIDDVLRELSDVESSSPVDICGNLGGDPCP